MTVAKAIAKAMALFDKDKRGDIRTVSLQEGSGSGKNWTRLLMRIEYAIDGDYTESDKTPYYVSVSERLGGIVAERVKQF